MVSWYQGFRIKCAGSLEGCYCVQYTERPNEIRPKNKHCTSKMEKVCRKKLQDRACERRDGKRTEVEEGRKYLEHKEAVERKE